MLSVADKSEIFERIGSVADDLHRLGVRRIGLFGSFARGEQTAESDVDLLVEFEPEAKTFDHLLDLGDLAESLLGRRVEIVTTESLSPYLGPTILSEVEYASFAA